MKALKNFKEFAGIFHVESDAIVLEFVNAVLFSLVAEKLIVATPVLPVYFQAFDSRFPITMRISPGSPQALTPSWISI